ncbi:hypothetical protein OUZ56_013477 [Daphnia magna]|uniref:THAP-type domain-containing protein n=1 Tax=Daphnia magna TaxID=35525 RepID=A0ABQ9Z782_9CRUS|nr:hypothetical protein OUZ56_013477 [Daphnia magna]
MRRVCCICGEFETQSRKSSFSFFSIPKKHGLLRANEIQLVERRISAWNAILGQYLNRHYGIQCVCSNHFHSGKPSYLYLDNDVDWVPSKNLSNLQQHEESGIENVADCSLQPQELDFVKLHNKCKRWNKMQQKNKRLPTFAYKNV